jgi:hypothetical protein
VSPEPVGRSKQHGNEQSASRAIHYAPGLIHTASMLMMMVNAGEPLLNLHQAGADAAGAQIPGSSAKTPICDFRSANKITIGGSIAKTAFETNTMFYNFHQLPYFKALSFSEFTSAVSSTLVRIHIARRRAI